MQEHESEQGAATREELGVREQEQSANTVRRAIVRTDQGVREHESEQQAAARAFISTFYCTYISFYCTLLRKFSTSTFY